MIAAIIWAAVWFFVFLPIGSWILFFGGSALGVALGSASSVKTLPGRTYNGRNIPARRVVVNKFAGLGGILVVLGIIGAWLWSILCIIMAVIHIITAISIGVG